MLDKFNFYDFLGYLIPGATVLLTVYWVGKVAFGVPFPDLQTDLTSSVLFIGLSYVVGHLVQGFGSIYEYRLNGKWKPPARLSERLLWTKENGLTDDQQLAKAAKDDLTGAVKDVFGVDVTDDKHVAVFEQCYALVTQLGLGQLTAVYLALNGLARGMIIASVVGFLAALALVLKQLWLMLGGGGGSSKGTWSPSFQQFVLGLVVMLVLIPVLMLFMREFERFRGYFARSVYYNFLAWYRATKFSPPSPPGPAPAPGHAATPAVPSVPAAPSTPATPAAPGGGSM